MGFRHVTADSVRSLGGIQAQRAVPRLTSDACHSLGWERGDAWAAYLPSQTRVSVHRRSDLSPPHRVLLLLG